MKAEEIREECERRCHSIVTEEAPDMFQLSVVRALYEIAAQLAEANQHRRQRANKHKPTDTQTVVRSGVRRSSSIKRFYVKHWGLESGEPELADFTPLAGKPHWQDIEVGQTTVGRLGTREDAEITRRF